MSCCPSTRIPALAVPETYSDEGVIENIDGVDMYIVGKNNKSKGKAVIVLADVFGFKSGRHRSIADGFAENYYVVLPDLFAGDRIESFADIATPRIGEFLNVHTPEVYSEKIEKVYAHLKSVGCENIGAIGFCWGAWAAIHECAKSKIKCAVHAHPSWKIESLIGRDVVDLVKKVQDQPQIVFACENDPDEFKPNGDVIKILKDKNVKHSKFFELEDQSHGFCSQGDVKEPAVARDVTIIMAHANFLFASCL